jgi:hypothetical protein
MKNLSDRTLKNFVEWYKKLTGRTIKGLKLKKVEKKFNS